MDEEVSEAGYIHTVVRLRPLEAARGAQTKGLLVSRRFSPPQANKLVGHANVLFLVALRTWITTRP